MTDDDSETRLDALFEPAAPTPGAIRCGGNHYARATRDTAGAITWVCIHCGKTRVMADGLGWR